jgi:hypothetical protein
MMTTERFWDPTPRLLGQLAMLLALDLAAWSTARQDLSSVCHLNHNLIITCFSSSARRCCY